MSHKYSRLSSHQRENELGWLPVREEIKLSTLRMTHKVVHQSIPEELACRMPLNSCNLRLMEAKKLDTKPRSLNRNKRTRASFHSQEYIFNTLPNRLTAIVESKQFNKWLKIYLRNPMKTTKTIPKMGTPKKPPPTPYSQLNQPNQAFYQVLTVPYDKQLFTYKLAHLVKY